MAYAETTWIIKATFPHEIYCNSKSCIGHSQTLRIKPVAHQLLTRFANKSSPPCHPPIHLPRLSVHHRRGRKEGVNEIKPMNQWREPAEWMNVYISVTKAKSINRFCSWTVSPGSDGWMSFLISCSEMMTIMMVVVMRTQADSVRKEEEEEERTLWKEKQFRLEPPHVWQTHTRSALRGWHTVWYISQAHSSSSCWLVHIVF